MAPRRWKLLDRFQESLNRWVDTADPPKECVAQVAQWITEKLPLSPTATTARRFNEDPRQRYVILPFRSHGGRYPLVAWQVEQETRTLVCVLLGEVDENARP